MENFNILQIVLNYFIPLILGGAIGIISTKLKKDKKKDKAIEEGVQALLRNELVRRYREYEQKGELSILDKENIEAMFVQYENLRRQWNCKTANDRTIATTNKNNKKLGGKLNETSMD